MERSAYERYLAAFNARDYDLVLDHFAERFEVVFAGVVLRTKPAVRDFYAFLHAHLDERIAIGRYLSDGQTIAMEADVRLEGLKPLTPAMLAERGLAGMQPLGVGQVVTIPQFIHYHLDAQGRFVAALCAVFQPPVG